METSVEFLGNAKIPSPVRTRFVEDSDSVMYELSPETVMAQIAEGKKPVSFLRAGPRAKMYFDPSKLKCAMVTSGGLCPGINNVIRSLVLTLYHTYGVKNILGIKYGLQGFIPKYGHDIVEMTPALVAEINELGGTVLSSSRGPQNPEEIVDALERMNVGILFAIGGDGTLRAALKIAEEANSRGTKISIIGIPKTIDNDIHLLSRSFGFNTAVSQAAEAITAAHAEATGAPNGIGLVKLMGRHAGFIAATAALVTRDANFVLIPEADFDLEGPQGLLTVLEERLLARKHAVIVVAEGAGQKFCAVQGADESGNPRLGDIGQFLKSAITKYFKTREIELNLKYIDPSYTIRSVPATADDAVYCGFLGQHAVHAGMAGKTNMMVGLWNGEYVYIPLRLVVSARSQVDLEGTLWTTVLESTGQPSFSRNRPESHSIV
jgi:6-phosphofructokinase 1